jgi:dihydroanticapsin dehydrogenase
MAKKVAYITGGMGGIGTAICQRMHKEGFTVIAGCGPTRDFSKWLGEQKELGYDFHASVGNVGAWDSTVEAFTKAKSEHGSIDVLVNNAGVNLPGVFHEVPDETIDRTIGVNVLGQIYACQAAIPHMLEKGSGSIVNVSSVNGVVAEPYLAVYATSKGAVVMLSRGIALDYAKLGIRCNVVCPGWVDTPINYAHADMLGGLQQVYDTIDSFQPIGRPGEPREIANVIAFLASDEASFVTGSVILADGGMTAQ